MKRKDNSATPKTSIIFSILAVIIQPIFFAFFILLFIRLHINSHLLDSRTLNYLTYTLISSVILFVILKRRSATDRLTHLPTQQTFIKQVGIKFFTHKLHNYTSIFFNLSGYKYINRMIGSANGDVVLVKYTRAIKSHLKPGELFSRLGGDNFIVLIKTKRVGAFLTFIQNVEITVKINGIDKVVPIATRSGIYELTEKDGIRDVLAKSSDALNYLKTRGMDNYLFYSDEIANEIYKEKQISYLFNGAIENKEFKVFYQPKINLKTKRLIGCEALVRWERNGEVVPPDEFIPVLEKTGLIKILDFYVMNQVCHDINSWCLKGLKCVPVATNFSKIHIHDYDFADQIIEVLNKHNTEKSLFELELTESANYEDYGSLLRFLELMHQNGIITAIDDFGIGYSSLSLLKNKNVKIVKIDKSFIDDIEKNNGDNEHTRLVQSIVQTCHALDKEVVCEGCENENQKKILEKMDCLIIQGFLYDKPLTYEEFEKRLENPEYK